MKFYQSIEMELGLNEVYRWYDSTAKIEDQLAQPTIKLESSFFGLNITE